MDFQLMSKYPKLQEVYEEILSEDWFKNYRKNSPTSSVQELGKINSINFDKNILEYFHNSSEVEGAAHNIVYGQMYAVDVLDDMYKELGVDPNEQQKIFDYLPLEKILELVDYKAETIAMHTGVIPNPDPDYVDLEAEEERWEEEKQQWLEDQADAYDPYDGDEPPDLSEGDEPEHYEGDDYSGYADEDKKQHEIDKQLKANKIAEDSGKIPYKKILSSEWVADYRKNPPASSFQELGDFSSYDEFKIKMNSLIVDLSKKNDFQSKSYQKLFDYLSLRDVFNLIQNNAY
jgi:hypothetical protein